jgi:biotin operon repressor
VLFEQRLRNGLADGTITVVFRRWRRAQVVAGGRYRTGGNGPMVKAEHVDIITANDITLAQARSAGYSSIGALRNDLRGDPSSPLFRVRFRVLAEPDPRSVLAETAELTALDLAALDARLARFDRAAAEGEAWTTTVLAQIASRPGVAAGTLAAELGLARDVYKRRVRSLKEHGLTISLETGYELSRRGQAYLAARRQV